MNDHFRAADPGAEKLAHELRLSQEIRRRLDHEIRRLESRIGSLELELGHLQSVLIERNQYLDAVHRSVVWRTAQFLRRLVGRAW